MIPLVSYCRYVRSYSTFRNKPTQVHEGKHLVLDPRGMLLRTHGLPRNTTSHHTVDTCNGTIHHLLNNSHYTLTVIVLNMIKTAIILCPYLGSRIIC